MLDEPWERLVDLDIALVDQLCEWLDLKCEMFRSSELGVDGDRSQRLVNLCLHFGAQRYLSGSGARTYLNTELFERQGIEVVWQDYAHPTYPQLHGEFLPYLSALDLLLNCGRESHAVLRGETADGEA